MFHTLARYDAVYLYLFDIFYIHWLYPACMALLEYNKENTNTKFQLLCTVIMTRKATTTGARYPYFYL
jgi:hypothetical protein